MGQHEQERGLIGVFTVGIVLRLVRWNVTWKVVSSPAAVICLGSRAKVIVPALKMMVLSLGWLRATVAAIDDTSGSRRKSPTTQANLAVGTFW